MALGTVAWGPAAIVANVLATPFTLDLDPAASAVGATIDCSLMPAGISRRLTIQYSGPSTGGAFVDGHSAEGVTLGGPDRDRHGNIIEWGIAAGASLPDVGASGRQVRVACLLGTAVAALNGHVTSG